jgi:glycosyltransferase involved in cell wall biosynthesis
MDAANSRRKYMARLLIAIPCLNEGASVSELLRNIPKSIGGINQVITLVIDDGSTDNTVELAKAHEAEVISHKINKGLGAVFRTASDYALLKKFDFLVIIDGDLQFDPNEIPNLVLPLVSNQCDVVIGNRFFSDSAIQDMGGPKKVGNKVVTKVINILTKSNYGDVSSGFRAYSREALLRLNTNFDFNFSQEILLEISFHKLKVIEIPVTVKYFKGRESRVANNLLRYGIRITKTILRTYRDLFPLKFFWFFSAISFTPSLFFGLIFLNHYAKTGQFSGYLFAGFTSAFFLSVSILFFVVGIIADMLARIRRNQESALYLLKKASV